MLKQLLLILQLIHQQRVQLELVIQLMPRLEGQQQLILPIQQLLVLPLKLEF